MSQWIENIVSIFKFRNDFERRVFFVVAVASIGLAAVAVFTSPFQIIAIILIIIALSLSVTRPYFIVLALAVWTPFEPFLLKFVPDELYVFARYFPEVMIYVMAVLVVIHVRLERKRLPTTPIDLPFILFLIAVFASIIINFVPLSIAALGLRQIIRYIIFYFAIVYLAPPQTRIRQTLIIFLGLVGLESIIGLVQAWSGGRFDTFLLPSDRKYFESIQLTAGVQQFWAPGQRVFGTLGRYDQLGTFLTFFMLIGLGLVYEIKKHIEQRWIGLLLLISLPALVLTYSRASWFGFILGFLIIGIWIKRDRRVAAAIGIFLAVVFSVFLYQRVVLRYLIDVPQQTVVERFYEAFSPERLAGEYYGLGRVYWWVTTPTVVVPHSHFFGFGPGQFGGGAAAALHNTIVYDKLGLPFGVYGTDGQVDSNWMSLWGEIGTIGIIFYLAMLAALARIAHRVYRRSEDPWSRGMALGFLGALGAVVFQAMLGSYLEVRTLALFLWLMAAFITVIAKREEIR